MTLQNEPELVVLFGAPLALVAAATDEVPEVKWLHVATAGHYRGHYDGEFSLTREVFESFVANLRRHPQYTRGEVEVEGQTITAGSKPTIQFDFEHASERLGSSMAQVAATGVPAPAWVLDLEIREGADGPELWALAKLGPRIREYIARNEYRQTSIAFTLQGVDFRTREALGPMLTSIAFTNDPFLQHLQSYAASRRTGQAPPNELNRAVSGVAPLETGDDDMTVKNATTPEQPDNFRLSLSMALGATKLLTDEELIEATDEAAKAAQQGKALAGDLGVDMEAAKAAIASLMAMREEHARALAEIDSILQANAVADQAMAEQDVAAVMSAKQWTAHADLKPALLSRRAAVVAEHLASVKPNEGATKLSAGQVITETEAARRKFLAEYGIKGADQAGAGRVEAATLTASMVAARGGVQLTPPASTQLSSGPAPVAARVLPSGNGEAVNLDALPGRNVTEKVIEHLKRADVTFARLNWADQVKAASLFRANHQIAG